MHDPSRERPDVTLVDLVARRAAERASTVAYRFLRENLSVADEITYGDLAERARTIAAHLQTCARPGDRALLLYPPGLEFLCAFLGCLHADVIAVPAYPPRGKELDARVQAIADDAEPVVGLATASLVPAIIAAAADSRLARLRWLGTDALASADAPSWVPRPPDADAIAHLQYTSGSTAAPKGVVVTHRNMLTNLLDMHVGWRHQPSSVLLSWLPHFHDMGLVYGLLGPLYAGIPGYLMAPIAFIQRPVRWLQAIANFGVTHSVAPNFAYDLCVKKIKPADRELLDLRSWEVAVNGAEPIRAETLRQFAETFAPQGFRAEALCPGYGLAETTLKVTASPHGVRPRFLTVDADALDRGIVSPASDANPRAKTLVGCGWTAIDTAIVIADPNTLEACPDGRIGEIWVGGATVAAGYWRKPAETAATFGAMLAGGARGPYVRTGDLGFVHDGELYVTGRIKEMLIIRGQNHYPQDIEVTVERCHPAFRQNGCAAFAVEADGEERLALAIELEREGRALQRDELAGLVRQAVAEGHEIAVYDTVWLRPGGIPRTSSGKIQRHACAQAYAAGFPGQLTDSAS